MKPFPVSRRNFLRFAAAGFGTALVGGCDNGIDWAAFFQKRFQEMSPEEIAKVLKRLEVFAETLLGLMNLNRQTFILTSDHGNVEDLSVPTHTYNPVPFTVAGRGERYLKGISSLYEITPSIMENVHYLL